MLAIVHVATFTAKILMATYAPVVSQCINCIITDLFVQIKIQDAKIAPTNLKELRLLNVGVDFVRGGH